MARQKNLVSRLNELHRDIDMSRINYLCFSKLAVQEQKSWRAMGCSCVVLAARLKDTKERLKKEKERHTLLQKKYKELLVQIRNCSGVCFSYELGVSFFHRRVLFTAKASLKFMQSAVGVVASISECVERHVPLKTRRRRFGVRLHDYA